MRYLITTLLILLAFQIQSVNAADLPYLDKEFACFNEADANKYIKDFNIDVASFGGRELCDAKIDTKKLLNDIEIVARGQFTTAGQNNLIRGFVDATKYYDWMKQQTRGVTRGNDVPYATAYNAGGYFTMQDGWAKLSTLGRVGTFIHEARHTEGFRHISCNQGTYQGTGLPACDTNYNYGGSHAVEMEYYARVSVQGQNFHPVYKKMARLMAIARSNFLFNTSPLQVREGLMGLTSDRKAAHLYDNGKWFTREVPQVNGRLKRTSYGAVLFDGISPYAIELYQNSGFSDLVSDVYSYYKLAFEKSQAIKELEEFDVGTKRYVVKITQANKLAAYNFPAGAWGNEQAIPFDVVKTSTAIAGQTQPGFFLINAAGEMYAYQAESQRLVKQVGAWDPSYKEVVAFKGQNYILKTDGQIYVQTATSLDPVSAKDSYAGLITVPLYDAFEVVKE
ncbi:MAG: hypothetical protein H7061_03240 [Bdellovibrionaceae bacterium]|nr:hypothetical protein [Bdellovibrio sp.]